MQFFGRLAGTVFVFAVPASPLLGTDQEMEWEIVSQGEMDGYQGFYLENSFDGALHETDFLFQEAGHLRVYAFKMSWQDEFQLLPESTYWVKQDTLTVGDCWDSWIGEPTTACVIGSETVSTPAGTFFAHIVEHRSQADPDEVKGTWWFSRDVGLVYGEHSEEPFEFMDYEIVGGTGFFPIAVGNWWLYEAVKTPARSSSWSEVKKRYEPN